MKRLSRATCCILLLLASLPAAAQQGKVELATSESKELKRSAYRLHMPPKTLEQLREALQEATDIARLAQPAPAGYFSQLGDLWVQLNRPKAQTSLNSLISWLRSSARAAVDANEYLNSTNNAQILISSLAEVDAAQALQWAHEWPDPSPSLGPAAATPGGRMERQIRNSTLQRLAFSDPDAALKLWSSSQPESAAEDYTVRGPLAGQLMQSGRSEEANKIIDRTISEFAAAKPAPSAWSDYSNFLTSLSQAAPDRFVEAFQLWAGNAPQEGLPTNGTAVAAGKGTVELDFTENMAMNILRSLGGRPELAMKALDAVPSLKAKLDQAGGLDNALSGRSVRPGMAYLRPGVHMRATNPDSDGESPDKIFRELRGKAAKEPEVVRSRLTDMVQKPEDVAQVLQLAMISAWQDPDLGCLAVEVARPVVLRVDDPLQQLPLFQQLLNASRQCEGEADTALIKQGFVLADELRQNEKEQGIPIQAQPGYSRADQLETTLVSELARNDFDAAIRYVRTMTGDTQKLAALVGMIYACRNPY